jgi:nitroreductase
LLEGPTAGVQRPQHHPLAARCERVVGALLRRIPYRPQRLPIADALARGRALQKELEQRRSCRLFSDEPIPREAIDIAIRCASTAPSGANRQPWRFVVIRSAEVKRAVRNAVEQVERRFYDGAQSSRHWREAVAPLGTTWQKPYLETVPWLVVVFAETHVTGTPEQNYHVSESVGIACGLFVVALHRMGLSTLPYTPTSMDSLGAFLGRPANEKPFLLFPVGYPARDATVPDLVRKPIEQVAVFEGARELPARDAARQTGT